MITSSVPLFLYITLLLASSCKTINVYEKYTKDHSKRLDMAAHELEKGQFNNALNLILETMDARVKERIRKQDLSEATLNLIIESETDETEKQLKLNLLSTVFANLANVDIIKFALKIDKMRQKISDQETLLFNISHLFDANDDSIKRIDFAIKLKQQVARQTPADNIYISTLMAIEALFYLIKLDKNKDLEISSDEFANLDLEDIDRLCQLIRQLIQNSHNIPGLFANAKIKSLMNKFEEINNKFEDVLKNGSKDKLKMVITGILRELKIAKGPSEYTPPVETVPTAPATLPIIESKEKVRTVQSMVVFGDSIAVGVGAAYELGQALTSKEMAFHPGVEQAFKAQVGVSNSQEGEEKTSDAKIIESYDSAYSATAKTLKDCATNYDPNLCFSHAARLGAKYVQNYARSGSKIQDVFETQLPKFLHENQHVDYIVINIGGNDFCSNGYSKEKYVNNYKAVLSQLLQLESRPVILVTTPPNVIQAFEVLSDSDLAFSVKDELTGILTPFTCNDIRWLFCPRATDNRHNLRSQSAIFAEMIAGLKEVVDELDPRRERIALSEALYSLPITREIMGMDCFHPNKKGYRIMGDMTFETVKSRLQHLGKEGS